MSNSNTQSESAQGSASGSTLSAMDLDLDLDMREHFRELNTELNSWSGFIPSPDGHQAIDDAVMKDFIVEVLHDDQISISTQRDSPSSRTQSSSPSSPGSSPSSTTSFTATRTRRSYFNYRDWRASLHPRQPFVRRGVNGMIFRMRTEWGTERPRLMIDSLYDNEDAEHREKRFWYKFQEFWKEKEAAGEAVQALQVATAEFNERLECEKEKEEDEEDSDEEEGEEEE